MAGKGFGEGLLINHGEREMPLRGGDFLGRQSLFVPAGYAHHGDSGPGDLGTAAVNRRVAVNQRSDFDCLGHIVDGSGDWIAWAYTDGSGTRP